MALTFGTGKVLPIGVDIGTSWVKMAQLKTGAEAADLLAAGAAEIPVADQQDASARLDFFAKAVRGLLRRHPFHGRQAILSLPATDTFVHHLRTPKLSSGDTGAAVARELSGKLPYPVDRAIVRHLVAGDVPGEGEAQQEVIAVCAERRTVESYLQAAARGRLDVVGVSVEPCAIVECFGRLFRRTADAGRTILFLDLGTDSTQVVLSHGKRVVFARNLAMGGRMLDQAVAEGIRIAVDQAHTMRMDLLQGGADSTAADEIYRLLNAPLDVMAGELTQCLRYYESVFRNQGVERVIFLGGQAYDKRLCQMLAQRLNLPAQIGDPLLRVNRVKGAGLDIWLDRREPQPNWAVAIGLSLGAAPAA